MPAGERMETETGNHTARPSAVQADLDRWQVRKLAVRVLFVQALALAGLWALQSVFGGS